MERGFALIYETFGYIFWLTVKNLGSAELHANMYLWQAHRSQGVANTDSLVSTEKQVQNWLWADQISVFKVNIWCVLSAFSLTGRVYAERLKSLLLQLASV